MEPSSDAKIQKMAEQEQTLRETLDKIAKEQGFVNYKLDIKPTSSEGANYTSVLFFATISEEGRDDAKVFAKVACVGEKVRIIAPFQIYNNEIYFYTDLIKTYRDIERKHGVPEEERLVTSKFYGHNNEFLKETIVMEDLTDRGYQMFDRFQTFDWNYAQESVRQMAKLHALSIAYSIEKPEEFDKKTQNLKMQNNNMDTMKDFMQSMLEKAITTVKEEFADRVQQFLKETTIPEKFASLTQPHRRLVLVHGDYRPSNLMHKLNEDGTYNVIPIDFQTLNRSNPVVDLLYFIFTGSDQEFRTKYYQKTLDHYYSELSASLKRFDLKPDDLYSREDFEYDLKQALPYGLLISFMLLLLVTVDVSNVPTITDDSDLSAFNIAPNEAYKKRINEIIEDYIKLGVL